MVPLLFFRLIRFYSIPPRNHVYSILFRRKTVYSDFWKSFSNQCHWPRRYWKEGAGTSTQKPRIFCHDSGMIVASRRYISPCSDSKEEWNETWWQQQSQGQRAALSLCPHEPAQTRISNVRITEASLRSDGFWSSITKCDDAKWGIILSARSFLIWNVYQNVKRQQSKRISKYLAIRTCVYSRNM